jgi:hypothetical protein
MWRLVFVLRRLILLLVGFMLTYNALLQLILVTALTNAYILYLAKV